MRNVERQRGAVFVTLLALALTQVAAALVMVLLWVYFWEAGQPLVWVDDWRLAAMAALLLNVALMAYLLSGRFFRRSAADPVTFARYWIASAGWIGALFSGPLFVVMAWEHIVSGSHPIIETITVWAIFVGSGAGAGWLVGVCTVPLAYAVYHWGNQAAIASDKRIRKRPTWLALAVLPCLLLGASTTWSLLVATLPPPVVSPLFAGASPVSSESETYGCIRSINTYMTAEPYVRVRDYYTTLAQTQRYSTTLTGSDIATLSPHLESYADLHNGVRYSNTPFTTVGYPPQETCYSVRVGFVRAATGTRIVVIIERPAHVHQY